jgi:hypothetical protein
MAWMPYFLEFHEVKLRKVKLLRSLTRARDRAEIPEAPPEAGLRNWSESPVFCRRIEGAP